MRSEQNRKLADPGKTNRQAMHAYVHRCLEIAADKPTAAERAAYCDMAANKIDGFIAVLGREDKATPEHLVGLTYWDLSARSDELKKAAHAYRRAEAA